MLSTWTMGASKSTRLVRRPLSTHSEECCGRAPGSAASAVWRSRKRRSITMAASTSGRAWAKRLGSAALLVVTVGGFYWKLTLTRQFTWPRGPDLSEQVLPWFQVQALD